LIIGILFAGLNTYNILAHSKSRRDAAKANAETVARVLAGALIGELRNKPLDSPELRHGVLDYLDTALTLNKKNKELAYVIVVSPDDELVVGRAKLKLTTFPGGKRYKEESKALQKIAQLIAPAKGKLGGHMRHRSMQLQDQTTGRIVGKLIVGTSFAHLEKETRREQVFSFGILAGVLLLLIIYSSLTLGGLVTRPLGRVIDAMRAVQLGNLDKTVDINRSDEIGLLADSYNFMVHGLREQARLKDAFNRYVSSQVYEKFSKGEIALAGETRQATILFSDIRSFTTLSEQLSPGEIVAMLNEYFTEMVEIIFKYDGFLNKFIGDALMAIYNVPLDQEQPEMRAVRTALDMLTALGRLNQNRQARGLFPVKIGVGVNTGPVVAGNIGHEKRLEYTVIGDAVNLAQRIESQTKVAGSPILISETTYAVVKDRIVAEALPPVKVKGKQAPVALYAVRGLTEGLTPAPFTAVRPNEVSR